MNSAKKILVIAYYWPPSGGSGVQRWLKFVKYLPTFGWKPYVFTPENPSYSLLDESLNQDVPAEAEVIRFPIWEPYDYFFKLSKIFGGKKNEGSSQVVKTGKKSFFERIATWVRGALFIPDPRIFWVRPSVKFLRSYLTEHSINIIVTTGPPHSIHLIGLQLKRINPSLKWVADFRDPWSEWGLLDSLNISNSARKKHKDLEYQVLSTADLVTTITPFYVRHFERLGKRKVELLTNGFDEADFLNFKVTKADKFIIRHIGIVNEKCDPRPFIDILGELIATDKEFSDNLRLEFIGDVHPDFKAYVRLNEQVNSVTTFIPSIPHKELMSVYGTSSVLLLVLHGYKDAEGYMPGKLFEYIATGLPVLGLGPENGDAAQLLSESGAGRMFGIESSDATKSYLRIWLNDWKNNRLVKINNRISKYSRRSITGKLIELISE